MVTSHNFGFPPRAVVAFIRNLLLPMAAFAAFQLHAAELSFGVSVSNWTTCVPVATATFPLGCDSVAIEWAGSQEGAYEQIVAMDSPAAEESWTVDLTGAVIGARRYYRLAVTESGSTVYSDPVEFTRFRLISHNTKDPSALAPGVQTLLSLNSTSILPFDNKLDSWPDNSSYATVGLRFMDGKRHIAGVRMYPRYNNVGRLNGRYFYASETYSEYDNNKVGLCYVSGFATSSSASDNTWKFFGSSDVTNTFECCWVSAVNGNVAEMRVFGWDADDEADSAGGGVLLDFIPRSADTNFYPVVTGIYPYGVDEAAVQVGRTATGEFSDLAAVASPDGSPIVATNTNCKVGQTRYYRLRTLKGNVEYFSTPRKFIRFRQLERSPDNPSTVRSGYAILNNSNKNKQIFDGSTTTPNADATNPIGINFKEGVHLAGFRYYPRQSWPGRLSGSITYAYANDADYSAGTKVAISPLLVVPSVTWRWFDSGDTENTYQYVTISPANGNLNEMEIYGWTQGDIDAAGDPFWPTYLNAVNGTSSGTVVVSWGGGANIESYDVLFRLDGDEQWTLIVDGLPPESTSHTVSGLAENTNCFFRVVARAGAEQGSPPDAVCFVYQLQPGPGTGLLRMLEGPASSRDLSKRSYYETNVVTNVNHYAASGSLFSNTNLSSAAAWYLGKLIVPIDGEYTLSTVVSNSDGSALYVDGRYRCGNFSSAGYKAVTMHLDAGQHDVAIGWRSVNTVKYFSFNWALENCWVACPVPQSQLVPADGSHKQLPNANFTYDGWDFSPSTSLALNGTGPYMSAVWREANGSYRLVGHGGDYGGNPGCLALLTREATGPFVLVCDFDTSALSGRPSLFVSKSATSLSSNCMNYIFSGGDFGFKGGQGNNDWGPAWHHGGSYSRVRMRIKREVDGTVTFAHKNLATPGADWVTSVEMPQGVHASTGWSLAQNKLWVGVSLFGAVSSSMSNVTLSNLSLVLQNGTVVRIR